LSAAASARPEPKYTAAEWEQREQRKRELDWEANNKKQLRKWRNLEIAAGAQFANRYEATPTACWTVEKAHSTNQQKVFRALKAAEDRDYTDEKKHHTRIRSVTINGEPLHRLVHISLGALSMLIGDMYHEKPMPISTLRRCLKRLAEKHSIVIHQVVRRGDDRVSNREASIFELPLYAAVLAARKNDEKIGTTHVSAEKPNGLQWTDGRSNSMNFLSQEKCIEWKIEQLVKVGTKGEIQTESNSARSSEQAVPSVQPATKAAPSKAVATQDVREKLKLKCFTFEARYAGKTVEQGMDLLCQSLGSLRGCDMTAEMLATAEAIAASHYPDPWIFPPECLVELATWALPKDKEAVRNGPPYILTGIKKDDGALVFRYLDKWAERKKDALAAEKKRAEAAYNEVVELLRTHEKSLIRGDALRMRKQSFDLLKYKVRELAENDSLREIIEALKEPV